MSDFPDEHRDRLAADAEAYENATIDGSTIEFGFECDHPGLAKTLRMLRSVFREPGIATSAIDEPLPPSSIGRFQIERQLGSGNFGSVWLAYDPLLKRNVAVKVAHIGLHARADLKERFQREAHLAARLRHPNIVPVFETDVDADRLFIVAEYCDGQSLAQRLSEHDAPLDPTLSASVLRQLADAVEHAHRRGLIHRDIKPANVLLANDSTDDATLVPLLTDFGLARDLTSDSSSTRSGVLLGTTEYMSPEQAVGDVRAHAEATDIFSLGSLLYRMLTGATPFTGTTDFEIIQRIISDEPITPAKRLSTIPRDLSSICLKCLEKRPGSRYATAAELRDDLDRFLRNEPTVARPIGTLERSIRWARRFPAAAALLCVVTTFLIAVVAGLGVYLNQIERHANELSDALQTARDEQALASAARDEAFAARIAADEQREVARAVSYRSDMRLAYDLWERGHVHQVRSLLERQRAEQDIDLRGPEWFILEAELRTTYRELGRHEGGVTECVLSTDQSRVYTAGLDGVVRQWDLKTGIELASFHPNIGEIHALAISPDELTLAVGGKPWQLDLAHVHLLDTSMRTQRDKLQTHKTTIESIAFSPDGRWLAAGSRYQPVQLTRREDGMTFTLPADRRNRSVSFSSDSRLLALVETDSRVAIWQLNGEEPKRVLKQNASQCEVPYVVRFSPVQPLLATSHANRSYIRLFDPVQQQSKGIASATRNSPAIAEYLCVTFSPDGRTLAAGNAAGELVMWQPNTRLSTQDSQFYASSLVKRHDLRITSVAVTDDSELVSTGDDGRVSKTSLGRKSASHVRWTGLSINDSVVSNGEMLLACEDGTVRRWKLDSSSSPLNAETAETSPPEVLLRENNAIRSLAVSSDARFVCVGTSHGGLAVYLRESGKISRRLLDDSAQPGDRSVSAIAFSSDSRVIAHTGQAGLITLHERTTGTELLSQSIGTGWSVSFLPGDKLVACGGRFEGIAVLNVATREVTRSFGESNTTSLAVSPDGRWLASGHLNGTTRMVDLQGAKSPRIIAGHRGFTESIAFSQDGRRVISLDKHATLLFTDVDSGETFGHLPLSGTSEMHADEYHEIHCTDSHLVFVTADFEQSDSSICLWSTTNGQR